MDRLTAKQREWMQRLVEAEAGTSNDFFRKAGARDPKSWEGGGWCWLNGGTKVATLTILEKRGLVEKYGGDFWRTTQAGRAALGNA